MAKKYLSVVGYGRVGSKVARLFLEAGFAVRSISRSLKADLPEHPDFQFFQEEISVASHFFKAPEWVSSDCVVICLPPSAGRSVFLNIFSSLHDGFSGKVILISSTSVYSGLEGDVDEQAELIHAPDSRSGRQSEVEETLELFPFDKVILRCGGLLGRGRHPGRFFSSGLGSGHESDPVNLVNEWDVARAVFFCYSKGLNGIFNCVYPDYPSKGDYYNRAALAVGGLPVKFGSGTEPQRRVFSIKLREIGFEFAFPIIDFNSLKD